MQDADPELAWEVAAMLDLDDAPQELLNQPPHANLLQVQATLQPSITTGDVIDGRYRVDALIGSGGIGAILCF